MVEEADLIAQPEPDRRRWYRLPDASCWAVRPGEEATLPPRVRREQARRLLWKARHVGPKEADVAT